MWKSNAGVAHSIAEGECSLGVVNCGNILEAKQARKIVRRLISAGRCVFAGSEWLLFVNGLECVVAACVTRACAMSVGVGATSNGCGVQQVEQ